MTSQPSLQTIAIHILPNISQSNDNQTMEFGQLIEHNKRNYSKIIWKMRLGDYSLDHILEFYVLVEIRLSTSKTKRDIWYSKFGIRVASRVADDLRLKILGNIRKISNLGGDTA